MSQHEVVGFDPDTAWVHVTAEDSILAVRVSPEVLKNLAIGGTIELPDDMAHWIAKGFLEWRFA
jgi:hypothetical protein